MAGNSPISFDAKAERPGVAAIPSDKRRVWLLIKQSCIVIVEQMEQARVIPRSHQIHKQKARKGYPLTGSKLLRR